MVFYRNCGSNIPSEESRFCPGCGMPTNGGTTNATNNTPMHHQYVPEKKGTGTGKIIGGFILILFGIAGLGYGLVVYNNQNQNIQDCNSLLGSFSQLDPNNASLCQSAPQIMILGIISGLIGFVMLIVGLILLAVGIKQKI